MAKVMEQSPVYQSDTTFNDSTMVMDFVKMKLGLKEREEFMVLFLDNQHKLLSAEILFQGTINATAVFPREVFKRALEINAAALILAHNHPSGQVTPSQSDRNITTKIKDAAALFDIHVLDHIIVGGTNTYSFVENLDL
ncbi:JAB domain-containing protein [Pasteurella multocida]|uniref:JAB domain-containing protein n=1 Tax=Pasteurella multocida TaxID=747 RepID=UPI003C130343